MRHHTPLVTIAAIVALALLVGVLLPSDNTVYAADPAFLDTETGTRSILENTPPGVNIGVPVSATDADETGDDAIEFGNTLTYSLGGADAASFDIDASTGQLITKAALDFENPHDQGGTAEDNAYVVTVTVDDGETRDTPCTDCTREVTITVTNDPERPGAPAAPTVVSTETDDGTEYELKVIWYAPDDTVEEVTSYAVQYKKTTEASFTNDDHADATTTTTIDELDVDTSYQVRVQATNSAGAGPWSLSSVGSTNKKDNDLPTFSEETVTRTVLEDADPGLGVGSPVRATDNDNVLPLAYGLHGPDANSFDLQASTGQIRTKRGVVYDFETKPTLNVTVTVSDRQGGTDARAVAITVVDVPEAPEAPARPTVRATPKSSRSLDVSWTEPENMGPAITGYDIRYRKGNSGSFTRISPTGTGTTYLLAPADDGATADVDERLTPGASYEVYVRAKNGEIPSQWSAAGTGRTSIGNSEPTFDDRPNLNRGTDGELVDATTKRTVAENTRVGQAVGKAVGAVDGNGDRRTYRLVAVSGSESDVGKFDINTSNGQILTKESLNHEDTDCDYDAAADTGPNTNTCSYTVMVQVWDGRDEHRNEEDTAVLDDTDPANDATIIDDEITVTITVSDVAERPAAPTVTVTSPEVVTGATEATLTVTWDRPENMGPAITGYVVECTGDGITTANPCPQPETGDLTALTDATQDYTMTLTPKDLTRINSYRVRVRADNNEGQGAWSSWVTQSTSKVGNALPSITNPETALYVAENADSARQPLADADTGTPITVIEASDVADGDTLTYRLDGPGAGRFDIDRNGQIRTRTKQNHEDTECYDSTVSPTTCSYSVRVKVSDSNGGSVFQSLTISVTDADEPPAKPPTPRVTATSGSGWSLEVTWNAPSNTGPPITGYQIQYRKYGDPDDTAWRSWPHTGTSRSAKITTIESTPGDSATAVHLEPRTQYEVQVRALNGEGDSTPADATNWSRSGRGTTGASNRRPTFTNTSSLITLQVDENTRSGQNIGSAVEATDPDKNRLTYTLEGPGKDSFTITSDGQIRTRAALNFEEKSSYSVTVKVDDRQRKANSVAAKSVTIEVTNRTETPSTPGAPRVAGIPGSTDSVRVTWDEPANPGPPITHYSVQYAVSGSRDGFQRVSVPTGSVDRSAVITGLVAGTRYAVQVRAESPEGHSDWSRSGTGSPNPDVANTKPTFSPRSHTFSVAENTPPGTDVGNLVAALDPDGDTLTYSLEGVDADSFDIIITNSAGQIQTKAALNHEEKSRYSVAVRARDGRGGTDAVNVTINVTDVDNEAPDTPFAPRVTAISSTRLQVTWEAPDNQGPPITDYDYRYRAVTDSNWTEVTNTTITATTATIDGLTPSTSYDVEVRAKNAEGASEWSNPGNGATNAPGANNPPVFTEGQSATRTVSASATPGTNIGDPVAATDADNDTVTYRLEGRDAANFDIDGTNGQLRTRTGVTLLVGTTYTVTVVADDTKDTTRITVSIEATAAPPNNPPVFRDGASTMRSVNASAPAGTAIGAPVTATDADTGDTVTYSLEGTDAASFDIVPASGQLRTKSGVTLTRTTYTVTVVADDGKGGRATIAVTINVNLNTAPVFIEGESTTRSVVEPVAPLTDIGSPVTATDADGDTLTYSLAPEGTDRNSFFIDTSTGQLTTKIELTVATKASYSVIVVASDRKGGEARITVTINVNPPPNNAPVFNEGTSATRSVREDASAGTSIGAPVTATDADNDTLTYSLEGTDAASFAIVASSGQLLTRSGVTLTANQAYTVTVVANDGRDSARITVTISVTERRTFGCATSVAVSAVSDASNTGLVSDCEALLRARNQLAGSARLNWHEGTPMNLWQGVFLGGTPPRVTSVVLRGGTSERPSRELGAQKLNGTIPADLGDLSMLTQLNLHSNDLSGSIPNEIANLTNMRRLFLHNNRLSGTIPDLSGLRSLERLWLSGRDMNLSGGVPAWLNSMSRLEQLSLWGNNLGGPIPRLTGMTSLSLLKLQSNNLTGSVPAWFGDMNGPATLFLHDNDLTGPIPANLGRNTGVVRLWLDRNNLTGSIPSELGGMTSLRTLNLRDNQLTGNIPPELGNLSRLQQLRLQNNRRVDDNGNVVSTGLTGAIPSELGDLGELLQMVVSNNGLSGPIPSELGSLGKLRLLWLHNNGLTGTIPAQLGDLGDTLSNIKLAGNSFDANACLPSGIANVAANDYTEAGLSACP